jgi:hypothetical protein
MLNEWLCVCMYIIKFLTVCKGCVTVWTLRLEA